LERKLLNNGSKLNRIEHCGIPEGLWGQSNRKIRRLRNKQYFRNG
jgi:hypothetical protein